VATVGTGTTITFDSGFFAEILSVTWSGISRPSIATSHMGTTTALTFVPGDLFDPGELSVELAFAPGTEPPWGDDAETVTVTWPDAGDATWAASGFLTGFEATSQLEERMTATATVKLSGDITVTP
jgi:hypothetical protein